MKLDTAKEVARMIKRECGRYILLSELCKEWDVTVDDFEEFINTALKTVKENQIPSQITLDAFVYPEDGTINGVRDPDEPTKENPPKMPFLVNNYTERYGPDWRWRPTILVESGKIKDWPEGLVGKVYYKSCDDCRILIDGKDFNEDQYVPNFLCPKENGYGDYIIMDIDSSGNIIGWNSKKFYSWYKLNKNKRN